MPDDLIKPVALAKELNVKPQMIYSWAKSGRIKFHQVKQGDKLVQLVSKAEVQSCITEGPLRVRKVEGEEGSDMEPGQRMPKNVKEGDILAYWRMASFRIGEVRPDDGKSYFVKWKPIGEYTLQKDGYGNYRSSQKKDEEYFQKTNVADYIRKGEFEVCKPFDLLAALIQVFEREQMDTRALEKFVATYGPKGEVL